MKRILSKSFLSYSYRVDSINPSTGEHIKSFDAISPGELEITLQELHDNFDIFRNYEYEERANYLTLVREKLLENIDEYAPYMTLEMGKPIAQSYGEINKCAGLMEWYVDNAEEMLFDEPSPVVPQAMTIYQPYGTIFQVAPFNFPFWQVIRFCTPAMLAGNTILIRHTKSCPQNGEILEEIFDIDGYPNFFRNVVVDRDQVTSIINDDRIRGVTFTGSSPVGAVIAEQSAKALKKHVLELGGSDPFIVLEGVENVEEVAHKAVAGRMLNTGQTCIASKRFIVHESIVDEFTAHVVERVKELKMGDPTREDTDIGPMAREDLLEKLHLQVLEGIEDGAELLIGGKRSEEGELKEGFFYEPTVLSNVSPDTPTLFFDETFGPVSVIVSYSGDDVEAIELANSSPFGLGGCVFSGDLERGETVARELECGLAFVNANAASHWALPFGGVKDSGYGRECGLLGLREWTNQKLLWIQD